MITSYSQFDPKENGTKTKRAALDFSGDGSISLSNGTGGSVRLSNLATPSSKADATIVPTQAS